MVEMLGIGVAGEWHAYSFIGIAMTIKRFSERLFALGFAAIVVLFAASAFALIAFSGIELWSAVQPKEAFTLTKRFNSILDCIAMLTIAMAAMELAQTVVEEEFGQGLRLSTATRARRLLLRFLVVVIVSLAIESLVAVFKLVQDDPSNISEASYIAFAAAALLVALGFFLKMGQFEEPRPDASPSGD